MGAIVTLVRIFAESVEQSPFVGGQAVSVLDAPILRGQLVSIKMRRGCVEHTISRVAATISQHDAAMQSRWLDVSTA
jgi:hypothetical protein